MTDRNDEREYASTPMGEMFRVGFKPIRTFFNDMSKRAQSAFWNFNDRLNGGVTVDDVDPPSKNNPKTK